MKGTGVPFVLTKATSEGRVRRLPQARRKTDRLRLHQDCANPGRSDGDGKLVNHRIRSLDKIALNCLLNVWVMQAKLID